MTHTDPALHEQERAALQAFHAFLDRHPVADDELIANPQLLDNADWLRFHRLTAAFLLRYPVLPGLVRANPHFFRWREVQRALKPAEVRDALAAVDDFVEGHPEQFPELGRDPFLLDDPSWFAAHPVLELVQRQARQLPRGGSSPYLSNGRFAW